MSLLPLLAMTLLLQVEPTLPSIVVEAEGVAGRGTDRASAIREAIRDAQQQAVEQVAGVKIAALEVGRDQRLQGSGRLAFSQGLVLHWESIGEPVEDTEHNLIKVRIRARVLALQELKTDNDWRALWKAFGHPPLQLTLEYTGDSKYRAATLQEAKTLLLSALQEIGVKPEVKPAQNDKRSAVSRQPSAVSSPWVLKANVRLRPVSPKGNPEAPYRIGDLVSAWSVQLTLELGTRGRVGERENGRVGVWGYGSVEESEIANSRLQIEKPKTKNEKPKTKNEKPETQNPKPETSVLGEWQSTASSVISDEEAVQKAVRAVIGRSLQSEWRRTLSQIWITSLLTGENRAVGSR